MPLTPTDELAKWLVPVLLGFIIFMMRRWINNSDKKMEEFADEFKVFTKMMNDDRVKGATQAQSCIDKHLNITSDLKKHDELLDSHTKDITKIKNKINIS